MSNAQRTCDFNGLRRNLAAAYNTHVAKLNRARQALLFSGHYQDTADSCAEIGNCIAGLLALSGNEEVVDLSDEVALRSPFGKD
jgi:hypothetical protein